MFTSAGQLYCHKVLVDSGGKLLDAALLRNTDPEQLIPSRSDITRPLRFAPNTDLLIAFAMDVVLCIEILPSPTEGESFTSHHLDDRWDEISGIAFSETNSSVPRIHVTSHLSSSTAHTTVLSIPLSKSETSNVPSWQTTINESMATFSAQHNLDGHVQERTWGIAASPLGDSLVTAITMVPSDSVAYVTPSEFRTTINITPEATHEEGGILAALGSTADKFNITTEVLLFSLQRYLDLHPESIDSETIVQAMLKTVDRQHSDYDTDNMILSSTADTAQLVSHLQTQVSMRPEVMRERFRLLANIALGKLSPGKQMPMPVIQCLVNEVAEVMARIEQRGPLSDNIREIYSKLRSKLQPEDQPSHIHSGANGLQEECHICRENIPFESVKWAKCGGGHQFSRCALTFMAVQRPDISKACGICGMRYLNEWKLPELATSKDDNDAEMTDLSTESFQAQSNSTGGHLNNGVIEGEQHSADYQETAVDNANVTSSAKPPIEPPSSFARILFTAFDVCLYCGGKFVP